MSRHSDETIVVGCFSVLCAVPQATFLTMKLMGVIGWSWYVTLIPLWVWVAVMFGTVIIVWEGDLL